jgi:hypothetical protein
MDNGIPTWVYVTLCIACSGLVVLVFWQMLKYRQLGQMYLARTRALDPVERYRLVALQSVEQMRVLILTGSQSEQLDAWLTLNSAVRAALTPDPDPRDLTPRWPRA